MREDDDDVTDEKEEWKTKDPGLLEVELARCAREKESLLATRTIECLEKRVAELEEEKKTKSSEKTTIIGGGDEENEDAHRGEDVATSEHLNSPVYDAVASMFGRFTGLGTTTTTTTTEEAPKAEEKDFGTFKRPEDEDEDDDGEESIVNIVVSENDNKRAAVFSRAW